MGAFYSIIIPAWNVEKYIDRCMKSCADFGNDLFEIIVVNDGSTDNTLEIVKKNLKSNIKVISTENKGLSEARNLGINKACGEYIIFLDADDWLEKEIEDYLRGKIKTIEADVIYYGVQNVRESDNMISQQEKYCTNENKEYTGKEVLSLCRKRPMPHEAWRGIYRRKFLLDNNICFMPDVIYEDVPFWFAVVRCAKKIEYTNRVFYNCFSRDGSITHSKIKYKNILSIFRLTDNILSCSSDSDYLEVAAKKITDTLMFCEKSIKTSEICDLINDKNEFIELKVQIIKKIEDIYNVNQYNHLKMTYMLISNIVTYLGIYSDELIAKMWHYRKKIIDYIYGFMKEWELDDEYRRIGIYGCGHNSDVILDTYKKICGEIKNEYYYVDTYCKSLQKKHFNHDIINVSDVKKYDIEKVIICSNIYEDSMYENIKTYLCETCVYRTYGEDTFSLDGIISGNYIELLHRLRDTRLCKRIILLQTPQYSNVGDHLIAVAEKQFIMSYMPEYQIVEISNDEYSQYKSRLKNEINQDDIIMITGGGFFGSLWTEGGYNDTLDILEGYPDNQIWVMPQTIYFSNDEYGHYYEELTKKIMSRPNLKICVREKKSYEIIDNMRLKHSDIMLCPDIALFYTLKCNKTERIYNTCGVILRDDKESVRSDCILKSIIDIAYDYGYFVKESSMIYDTSILRSSRADVVKEKLEEISKYSIVVTDRLHCMIMCAITKTPCIVFDNLSNKVYGVYKWIESLDYIVFVSDENNIREAFRKLSKNDNLFNNYIHLENEWNKMHKFFINGED